MHNNNNNNNKTNHTSSKPNGAIDIEDDDDETQKKEGYKWTKEFERTWESITEDERGLLAAVSEKKRQ